jgi:L-Ala-D/L-Glu epimerase
MKSISMMVELENWPRAVPLRITGYTHSQVNVVVVTLERAGKQGRGEGAGIYYKGETQASMLAQIEQCRTLIESGAIREQILSLLPRGGARNALDCAYWDLEAKEAEKPVWMLAGLPEPKPLTTTFTCSAEQPQVMADAARAFSAARAIKVKLTGSDLDRDRVIAVRQARQDVWLCVDANQGFTRSSLERLMPTLLDCDVGLIEQPFPSDKDEWLDGFRVPIPIAADESLQGIDDVRRLAGRFAMGNIKLDKCGGFTEGLQIARALKAEGMKVMVGSMGGTSLAMGPIFLVGQLADVADLDGPALLARDRAGGVTYQGGAIMWSESLWGQGRAR